MYDKMRMQNKTYLDVGYLIAPALFNQHTVISYNKG